MSLLYLLLTLLPITQFDTTSPRNVTAPYISSTLEQLDGSRVNVRYRAVHWDPITADAVFEDDETRDYYNHFILTKVGTLENNVQIAVGANRLNPGTYYLGVEALKNTSSNQAIKQAVFLISDDNNVLMRIPVNLTVEAGTVPNLSVVFTPGVTDRDFVFNTLFGNLSLTLKMRFSGVPARPSELSNLSAPDPSKSEAMIQANVTGMNPSANNAAPMENIVPVANQESVNPQQKQRSGLGMAQQALQNSNIQTSNSDTKMLGGMAPDAANTAAMIDDATMVRPAPKPKAGSGVFRFMNIRP